MVRFTALCEFIKMTHVVELDFSKNFLPYSFRLIRPLTKQGYIHPWSVKIGLMSAATCTQRAMEDDATLLVTTAHTVEDRTILEDLF
jgi:hypothetical protein